MWLNLDDVASQLNTRVLGRRVIYLTSTTSTMDIARREAESGADEGTVVIAEEQTAGRGRFGRKWVSPTGENLYLTLLLRPDVMRLRSLSIVSPLAVCQAVETTTTVRPVIKWPNDVLIRSKKLSGILIETEFSGQSPRYALVGIGLNVNFRTDDTEVSTIATSLAQETRKSVSREDVLASLLNHFETAYQSTSQRVYHEWKSRLQTIGRDVTITFRDEKHTGVAEDVDRAGNLLLRTADGSLLTFEAGEVSLRA
jgi:BirA family biotin operon repressor/biotin-[acetyl-CoA-carboxylase] ligase